MKICLKEINKSTRKNKKKDQKKKKKFLMAGVCHRMPN